jgi:hypothetical protein
MVLVGADGVHAQQLAGHLEAGDLLGAFAVDLVRLEVAKADRVQVLVVADAEQGAAARTLRRRPMISSSRSISLLSSPIGRQSWCMLHEAQLALRISMVAPGITSEGSSLIMHLV